MRGNKPIKFSRDLSPAQHRPRRFWRYYFECRTAKNAVIQKLPQRLPQRLPQKLSLVTKVAKRRRGSEWYAGGMPEPRRDRAAARRWLGEAETEGIRSSIHKSSCSFLCCAKEMNQRNRQGRRLRSPAFISFIRLHTTVPGLCIPLNLRCVHLHRAR